MDYFFEDFCLDVDRRELRRGSDLVDVEPQVFDILHFLLANRARVVSKDDLLKAVWNGRVVSESALSSRITAVRHAIDDSGGSQRLIRTIPRKGLRFVGLVREARTAREADEMASGSPEHSGASAPLAVGQVGGERRQVTIVACDFLPPNKVVPGLDPEDFGEILSVVRDRIEREADRFGGVAVQQLSGRHLVCFGYPQAHENDAERAIRAGLAIVEAIGTLRARSLKGPLHPRVGIATGIVVAGPGPERDSAAVQPLTGDTPNLAEGALAVAESGSVVVTNATRRLAGGLFEYLDVHAAGRPDASDAAISRVLGESAIASRFEALRNPRAPFVGRDEELELLQRRWQQAKSGEGKAVLICGEPGIGKSRLVAELEAAIAQERPAAWRFYCAPHRTQTALFPVVDSVERAAGFAPSDSDATKLAKLAQLLLSQRGDAQDNALFADLLSIPATNSNPISAFSPQRRKELVMQSFVARLAATAAREPVLVVLEDVHWVDATTRDLFDLVVSRLRDLAVLVVITYRPEFVPPWLGLSHVTAIMLNRLGPMANSTMIKNLIGKAEIPPILLRHIIERADGVPLYIEELTNSVLEGGAVRREGGAPVISCPESMPTVPATLQASLAARFDRLASVRTVMQTGAALGREFSYKILKSVIQLDDVKLQPLLDRLVASGLVHQRGAAPDSVYTFKHALVQDAAYETLLKRQRIALHARTKAVLETESPETPLRHPDVLAYHCAEAELWQDAVNYYIRAARVALARCAPSEAQAQVEKAIALTPKIDGEEVRRQLDGRLQLALADCLVMTKGFASPDVAATLSRGRDLLEGSKLSVDALKALCGLFNYHLMRSEAPSGLRLVKPFLDRALDPARRTVVQFLAGSAFLHIGDFQEARRHLEASLSSYDAKSCRPVDYLGGYHIRSFTLVWLGLALLYLGDLDRADTTISHAIDDARSRAHPFTLVSALLALARFLTHKRDLAGAVAATDEGLAIAIEQRSPYHVSRANVLRAVNLIRGDRAGEGADLMERALSAHRETGANFQSSFNLSHLALAHAALGKVEHATEVAAAAVAEVARSGERWWEAEALRIQGEILRAAGPRHRAEAETCFRKALTCARQQKAWLWELRAARSLANVHGLSRCPPAVRKDLLVAHARFAKGPQWRDIMDAKAFLSRPIS